MKAPVSLCVIVRNEPKLEQCLRSLRDYVEEIVVVDTGSTDGTTVEIAKKYADIFEVFTGCNDPQTGLIEDFSLARQRSFDLATQKWVLWADGDDKVVGGENLLKITQDFETSNQDLDAISYLFPYEYSYDAEGKCNLLHYRERLFYNKHAFMWTNPVHECCITKSNLKIAFITRDDLVFKHQRQFSPKVAEPGRNLRILKKYYQKVGDTDARQLYYLGLECCNSGLIDESVKHLIKYIELSGWEDERVMAALKLVDIYQNIIINLDEGLKWAFKSIEIKETWSEGYFALAKIFYFMAMKGGVNEIRNWQRCVHFAKVGLDLPPTKTLLFINPLERSCEMHKYYNFALNKLGRIQEALDDVMLGLQNHPTDPNFIMNKKLYQEFLARQKIVEGANLLKNIGTINQSAVEMVSAIINNLPIANRLPLPQEELKQFIKLKEGALDIVFFTGDGVEVWTPDTIKKTGMGGSELMACELAKRLSLMGHKVRVYNSCGTGAIFDGVSYRPTNEFHDLQCDVLVVSRFAPALADQYSITAKLKLLWVHDIWAIGATNELLLKADRILALSEWHKQNLINAHNLHPDQIIVTRNGIDLSRFDQQVYRHPYKCVNSSSPDRSWPILLSVWPRIKQQVPQAELHLFYGFKNWEHSAKVQNDQGQLNLIAHLKQQVQQMASLGVVFHDRVNQETLAKEFLSAGAWIYPTWFTETFCISAAEAQAAGLRTITSSIAALNETVAARGILIDGDWTTPQYQDKFIQSVVETLNKTDNTDRLELQKYAKEHFGLDELAQDWEKMFYSLIEELKANPIVPYMPTTAYREGGSEYKSKEIQLVNIVKSRQPKISVLDLTNRVGGMDILFESLKNQSFQDFELIIVDALYKYRKDVVAEKSKLYNFPVKHIEPSNNTFPVSSYNNSMNTGLCAAEGEILHFTCDYAHMQKDTLLTHAKFHAQTPRTHVLMLPCHDCPVKLEAVSNFFPKHRQYGHRGLPKQTQLLTVPEEDYVKAHNEWSDRYVEDLNNGFLDKVLWSIFEEPFVYEQGINRLIQNIVIDTKFDNCSATEPTPAFHDLCCVKNDSFKLDLLMEANGFDEQMDGTWGFFDTELSRRLLRCHGARFFAMNTMGDEVINTRYYLEPRKIVNGYQNIKIIDAKYMKEQPLIHSTISEFKKSRNIK